jgi:hypothetical protein
MASVIVEGVPPRSRAARSPFYVGVSLYVVATVLAGFAPSFYLIAVDGKPRPWVMHLHAAVYLGWLALLMCQVVLAARGKIATHRRVGTLGIYYALALWVLGLIVSIYAPAAHVRAGEWSLERAITFLPIPLGDMVLFGSFFGSDRVSESPRGSQAARLARLYRDHVRGSLPVVLCPEFARPNRRLVLAGRGGHGLRLLQARQRPSRLLDRRRGHGNCVVADPVRRDRALAQHRSSFADSIHLTQAVRWPKHAT